MHCKTFILVIVRWWIWMTIEHTPWTSDTWQFNWGVYHTAGKLLTGSTLTALYLACEEYNWLIWHGLDKKSWLIVRFKNRNIIAYFQHFHYLLYNSARDITCLICVPAAEKTWAAELWRNEAVQQSATRCSFCELVHHQNVDGPTQQPTRPTAAKTTKCRTSLLQLSWLYKL